MDSWANRQEYVRRLNRVLDHIEAHIGGDLTLETLASVAAFSPYHFHRVFLAMVGEPLGAFLRRVRLEKAAFKLQINPRLSITEVALEHGFGSSAAFARAFKERFGVSASQWRARGGVGGGQDGKICKVEGKQGKAAGAQDGYLASCRVEGPSEFKKEEPMEVKVEQMKAVRALYVRRMGPYARSAGEAWDALCRWAGPRGLLGPQTMMFGVSYDDPETSPAAQLRYDACISVGPQVQPEGEVCLMTLPAGRVAKARYEGPGAGIAGAYKEFYGQWLPSSGYVPAEGAPFEVYVQDPKDDHFVLDICVPVVPA